MPKKSGTRNIGARKLQPRSEIITLSSGSGSSASSDSEANSFIELDLDNEDTMIESDSDEGTFQVLYNCLYLVSQKIIK